MSSRWIRGLAARLLTQTSAKSRQPKRRLRLESLESRYAMNADVAESTTIPAPEPSQTAVVGDYEAGQDSSASGGEAYETDLSAYTAASYGGDSYGGTSYGGDPYGGQAFNQTPVITGFEVVYIEGGDWGVQGRVLDDQPVSGRSLQLTGTLEMSLPLAADGTFFLVLEGNEYFSGTLCASYTDDGGLSADPQWASFG